MNRLLPLAALTVFQACGYEEGLVIENLRGTVHIPAAATVRTRIDDGTEMPPDIRAIGPVYLGLYSSILPSGIAERYPYPEIGPQFIEGVPGDTYPYGGTSLGDLRFACIKDLACKVTSGRFADYDAIVDWFNAVDGPVVDANDAPISSGAFIQQECFDVFNVNSDLEVRITAYEDRNGDGEISDKDLDFVFDEDAQEWVGQFIIRQQEHFYDQGQENCIPGRTCKSFSLWGWMDTPSDAYSFRTCDSTEGFNQQIYDVTYTGGRVYQDVLNFPTLYIENGDYVSSEGYEWKDVYAEPDLYLDLQVQ